jgi:hypothetical protein
VERARGHLYSFHQLCGTADVTLEHAVQELRPAGQQDFAGQLATELGGRNAIEGRRSFQIVEDYDDN